jgi:long-subunit fatty acid transport protein
VISRLVLLLAALLLVPSRADATPPDLFGYGARNIATGMTGVSYADDYEATYLNPAGLARAKTTGLRIGMLVAPNWLKLDGDTFLTPDVNGDMKEMDTASGAIIGFQLPIPFGGPLEDVLTLGAGFYTPNNAVLRVDLPYTDMPQWPVLGRAHSVAVNVGLGIDLDRWVPGLRFGVGAAALATIVGQLHVSIDEANQFRSRTENQILAQFAPVLGASYDTGPYRFGLSYRGELRADIDLKIDVVGFPIELPQIEITAVAQYSPHTLMAEAAFTPSDAFLVALNLTWRRWSAFPGTLGKTTDSSYEPPRPDFHDTVSPRVGGEYRLFKGPVRLAFRAGYAFEPTPSGPARLAERGNVPSSEAENRTVPLRYLDGHRHVLSAGTGLRWKSKSGAIVDADLFASPHRISSRTHDVSRRTADEAAESGDPEITENMVSSGWMLVAGAVLGVSW